MDTPQLTEDEMAEVKKEVLERLRPYLCEKIKADRHFDYLRSRKILTREDTEDISCRVVNSKKTGRMLDFLAENPKGLDTLIESIHKIGTQDFVITKIINEIQKVKSERNKAGRSPSPRSTFAVDSGVNIDTSSTHSSSLYYSEQQWNPNITSLDSLNLSSGAGMEVGAPLRSISLSSAASLPRPGDLGAPLIPEDSEAVPHSWSSSGSDDQFQTLRCHSLLAP